MSKDCKFNNNHRSHRVDLFKLFWSIRHLPDISATLDALLQPKATSLPGHIQAVYVQNIVKLYAKLLANQEEVWNVTTMWIMW